jgi:hypothetical protein
MLVRMKNGNIEDLYDDVALRFIANGLAERLVLKAEDAGGPAATVGIEMAMLEPKPERAVVKYFRTVRSRIGV